MTLHFYLTQEISVLKNTNIISYSFYHIDTHRQQCQNKNITISYCATMVIVLNCKSDQVIAMSKLLVSFPSSEEQNPGMLTYYKALHYLTLYHWLSLKFSIPLPHPIELWVIHPGTDQMLFFNAAFPLPGTNGHSFSVFFSASHRLLLLHLPHWILIIYIYEHIFTR